MDNRRVEVNFIVPSVGEVGEAVDGEGVFGREIVAGEGDVRE